jgi:hypothetical protein
VKLDPDDIEAIAARVAELLGNPPVGAVRYLDAAALARTLGVKRDWIYAHAADLGAIRLGGPHGRLRFDLQHVRRVLGEERPDAREARGGVAARGRRRRSIPPPSRANVGPKEGGRAALERPRP